MDNRKKILLCIDDELVGLRVRKLILERSGYEVLTASDGPSGLELFEHETVDAVVLDFYMPQMDGGHVARRMKSLKPTVPILSLSAYISLPEHSTDCVDAYLTKGQPPEILLEKIRQIVDNSKV